MLKVNSNEGKFQFRLKRNSITMSRLNRKIDFIHHQCIAFAAERERHLPTMPLTRLYIGVDRQDYMINWSDADDRRHDPCMKTPRVVSILYFGFLSHRLISTTQVIRHIPDSPGHAE